MGRVERSWQTTVEGALSLRGWLFYHTYDSRRSVAGFPDLIALRRERMLVIELKDEAGKLADAQAVWLAAFASIPGAECFVWRPSDWPEVQRVSL